MYKRNIISFYVVYINAVKSRKLFTTFKLRFKVSIILTKNEKNQRIICNQKCRMNIGLRRLEKYDIDTSLGNSSKCYDYHANPFIIG